MKSNRYSNGLTPLKRRVFCCACVIIFGSVLLFGCKTLESVTSIGATVASSAGLVSSSQAESITKSGAAVAKSFESITPEQEYFIGRTIGAMVLQEYKPYNAGRANQYLNTLGQTLAQASDRPETFNGYHFLIMDSDDINAFAAPGGLIFVTRGMLRCCNSEDAVAAVLAHEIGHVQHRHGLQAIKKSRITTALTTLGMESAKALSGAELSGLTDVFEDSIRDITQTMVNNGYSRSFEKKADQAAVTIMQRVGYDPNALVDMLKVMEEKLKPGGKDFAKTHPSPEKRISYIEKEIGGYAPVKTPKARQRRFRAALKGV